MAYDKDAVQQALNVIRDEIKYWNSNTTPHAIKSAIGPLITVIETLNERLDTCPVHKLAE